jgi:hypothetical protein
MGKEGIVGPAAFPIRDPKDPNQTLGRNVNPVRYPEIGGMDSAAKWAGSGGKSNDMKVEKPTNVRAAKSTTGKTGA